MHLMVKLLININLKNNFQNNKFLIFKKYVIFKLWKRFLNKKFKNNKMILKYY